jgi:FMN reductase
MKHRTIVGFSANGYRPSMTYELIKSMTEQAGRALSAETHIFDLHEIDESLRAARFRSELAGPARRAMQCCEAADGFIMGIPSLRRGGSYPGLFKHFFDLADVDCMEGKPVLIFASGIDVEPRRIKVQLRLLFRSVNLAPVPRIVYSERTALKNIAENLELLDELSLAQAQFATRVLAGRPKPPIALRA